VSDRLQLVWWPPVIRDYCPFHGWHLDWFSGWFFGFKTSKRAASAIYRWYLGFGPLEVRRWRDDIA